MHNPNIKYEVLNMRKEGHSFNDIIKKFNLNKSTISFWCRDIVLSNKAIENIRINGKIKSVQGLLKYSEKKRKERIERVKNQNKEGSEMLGKLSHRDLLLAGLGLYWGEGYKNGELGFTNSNPKVISFYIRWLNIFSVSKNDLIFRLTINEFFRRDEKNIKNFWISLLKVKEQQFSKTTYIKTILKKAFDKDKSSYKGILRVKVRRGTALKNKILGAIDHISYCKS